MKLARRCKTAPLAAALMLVFAGAAVAEPAAEGAAQAPAAGTSSAQAGSAKAPAHTEGAATGSNHEAAAPSGSSSSGAASSASRSASPAAGTKASSSGTAASSSGAAGAAPAGKAAAGTASSGTAPSSSAGADAQPAHKVEAELKVGFVLPTTPDGSGWSRSHQNGIDLLREKLGDRVQVTVLDNVRDVDAEKAFRQLADEGNRLIIGTGPSYDGLMRRLALEYPDVRWEVAGLDTSAGNIRAYGARSYEGVYLAGVAAGKMTKTDVIGFVAPVPIPEVVRNIDAFALGAQSVNPTARVKVAWINGWNDPIRETEATQTLITTGADVIISNTGTDDALKQAERVGKYGFGWASDRSAAAPKAHLGSVAFDWGEYYVQSANQVLSGRWKPTPTWHGVKDGRVDLVALSEKNLSPEARAAVQEKREALKKGTLQIWKGPLVTVDDRELLPAGKVADDRFLESLMTLVKGVEGQVPVGR